MPSVLRFLVASVLAGAPAALVAQIVGSITLVNPEGKDARCAVPATREEAFAQMQAMPPPKDFGAFGALTATYSSSRITLLEYCARRYELAGYARRIAADPGATGPGGDQSYVSPAYQWLITYPAGWKIDAAAPGDVRILAPDGTAQCGMHSAEVRFNTVDEYADFMRAFNEKYFKERGVTLWASEKRPLPLPNGASGMEVLTDMSNGGRSRRVYLLAASIGYVMDCETHTGAWEKFEPFFARIIASLTFGRKP